MSDFLLKKLQLYLEMGAKERVFVFQELPKPGRNILVLHNLRSKAAKVVCSSTHTLVPFHSRPVHLSLSHALLPQLFTERCRGVVRRAWGLESSLVDSWLIRPTLWTLVSSLV